MSERDAERRARSLRRLARILGVQTAFHNDRGQRRGVSTEALLAALEALEPGLVGQEDGEEALRLYLDRRWHWACEPVIVAWDGRAAPSEVRLPAGARGTLSFRLEQETGDVSEWSQSIDELAVIRTQDLGGVQYVARSFVLAKELPAGYHELQIQGGELDRTVLVISAPRRAYEKPGNGQHRGVFLPLYALHSASSWGAGDFSDLASLSDWVSEQKGQMMATLPILPTYLSEPYEPSPYSPVSRLFWNEFYVDPRRAAALSHCEAARETMASPEFQAEVEDLRSSRYVDYRRQMLLKRRVLTQLAGEAFAGRERSEIDRFIAAKPEVIDYGRFRMERERLGRPWGEWPEDHLRGGEADWEDEKDEAFRFYVYAQYLADQQLQELASQSRERGGEIYLDLPLGCHPDGYDTWRHEPSFVSGVAVGAPPDSLFTGGQNWGFPPPHPGRMRDNGYEMFRSVIRHHLQFANVLRIDHVMGLHRLYWIPTELPATQGVYVRYQAEELYAILSLESHRCQATIMGENLGTVPAYVDRALSRHGIYQSYVLQYELSGAPQLPARPPRRSFASLNTHDMPPFAGFLAGRDIEVRRELGMTPGDRAEAETEERKLQRETLVRLLRKAGLIGEEEPNTAALFKAAIEYLGASRARYLIVNIEDSWGEMESQNVPGTVATPPNWALRTRLPLENVSAVFPQTSP